MNGCDGEQIEELNRQDAKFAKGAEKRCRVEPGYEIDELARVVIGAAIELHRHLGPGYLEKVYEDALAVEFQMRGIPHERQATISVVYKGQPIGEGRLDFLVGGCLIVELKTVEEFASVHRAQVMSYLKATGLKLALLINFNVPALRHGVQRVVLS